MNEVDWYAYVLLSLERIGTGRSVKFGHKIVLLWLTKAAFEISKMQGSRPRVSRNFKSALSWYCRLPVSDDWPCHIEKPARVLQLRLAHALKTTSSSIVIRERMLSNRSRSSKFGNAISALYNPRTASITNLAELGRMLLR